VSGLSSVEASYDVKEVLTVSARVCCEEARLVLKEVFAEVEVVLAVTARKDGAMSSDGILNREGTADLSA
jgi:hypothetical protein